MEITYTEGPMNLNWKFIMGQVASDNRFYMNTQDDEVTEKEAGWEFLRLYGREDESDGDEDDEDSGYSDKGEEEADSVSLLPVYFCSRVHATHCRGISGRRRGRRKL